MPCREHSYTVLVDFKVVDRMRPRLVASGGHAFYEGFNYSAPSH